MDKDTLKRISKKMSYVLRHRPEVFNLSLDAQGWAPVAAVLDGFANENRPLTLEEIEEVVENNNKKRFEFNEDKTMIRARQGHSVKVELGYTPQHPPAILYHGTPSRNRRGIQNNGLARGTRHHVHLSPDIDTAKMVALRRGKDCTIFAVRAGDHALDGASYFKTDNNVWLVEHVPPKWLSIHSTAK